MYTVLQNDLLDQDERIDILMTVKNTVKVSSCRFTSTVFTRVVCVPAVA